MSYELLRCEAHMTQCFPQGDPQPAMAGWQCGLPAGHSGEHSLLIPTAAPWRHVAEREQPPVLATDTVTIHLENRSEHAQLQALRQAAEAVVHAWVRVEPHVGWEVPELRELIEALWVAIQHKES